MSRASRRVDTHAGSETRSLREKVCPGRPQRSRRVCVWALEQRGPLPPRGRRETTTAAVTRGYAAPETTATRGGNRATKKRVTSEEKRRKKLLGFNGLLKMEFCWCVG